MDQNSVSWNTIREWLGRVDMVRRLASAVLLSSLSHPTARYRIEAWSARAARAADRATRNPAMLRTARMPTVVVAIAFLWCGDRIALGQTRPPNIVLIVADDMGYADIGIHGSKDIPTPNIDALARAGVRFTDAYVTGPYCSPTRAGLLTGRYQQRFGHEFNLGRPGQFGLPLSETTLADRLRAAGYRTAVFGKWHLGGGEKFHPM